MDEDDTSDRLKDLGARIDKARTDNRPASRENGAADGRKGDLALGLRIGLELVVAVGVGAGMGLLLDRWLGSRPWGMIGCFFLGVAVGMVNVYRTVAGLGMTVGYRKTGTRIPRESDEEWDED